MAHAIAGDGVDRGGQCCNHVGIKAPTIEPRTATPSGLARRGQREQGGIAWPMTSWPRRRAVWISEPRMASSSRLTGPRAPTARSMAMASLPALPELRHRPGTSGTERGRSRPGPTRVMKHGHSRNAGRLALAGWSKRTETPGRQGVVNHDKPPPLPDLTPDDPAQRRDQAEQP